MLIRRFRHIQLFKEPPQVFAIDLKHQEACFAAKLLAVVDQFMKPNLIDTTQTSLRFLGKPFCVYCTS